MELSDIQDLAEDLIIHRWKSEYFSPLSMIARLAEETGELAREVNAIYGDKPKKPTEEDTDLALEMGDVLFTLACMANRFEIDLNGAYKEVIRKYIERDDNRWTEQKGLFKRHPRIESAIE